MTTSSKQRQGAPQLRKMLQVLGALLIVAFWPFALAELFWDDYLVIRPDGPIAHLSTIGKALYGRCVLFDPHYQYPYYRPLIDILFILEYAVVGTGAFLYHLTNFLLHSANAMMVMLLLVRVLPRTNHAALAALIGAGVFALHPIQCESVLWPAARPAVLSLFFLMLCAHSFLNAIESERRTALHAIATVACFIAALLSKEVAIAALPVALLLFGVKGARPPRVAVYTSAACAIVLIVYLVANSAVGSSASHLGGGGIMPLLKQGAASLGFYILKLFVPTDLHPSYAGNLSDGWANSVAGGAAMLAAIVALVAACVIRTRTAFLVAAGMIFFCGSACLPLLASLSSLADRYVYQAMAGLGVVVAVAIYIAGARVDLSGRRATFCGFGFLAVVALTAMHQSTYWISAESMWLHTTAKDPANYDANIYLGEIAENRGDLETAERRYLIAMGEGATLREDGAMAVGRVRFARGNNDGAITAFESIRQNSPLENDARIRMAVVEFSRSNIEKSHALIAGFADTGAEPASVYLNLALLALRMDKDHAAASRWYEMARERGAAESSELEALRN
ncbi:tetratricopeptide repeat protein [soil metagenome]